ncbi:uroporphyrinogen-III synthase [Parasulfuritortus cantonensis]|uniref:Uroporphyrinogen-III synthase n=1 Tax=Parasulfuritortus cantonensis TaxID=2528202 RepID=A0A4R1B2A6_9PROT|nr:uroporphyrinogen-III synthase [Parasulfuritortus cantonensis]TCJ11951.1 uroporphyrinogen-III synthase [Parasulfuritortus cantonensis]
MDAGGQPLAGRGILVTRPANQAAGLAARLAELGARPVLFPALAIAPPADPGACADALAALPGYDHAIFVSPTSVEMAWPGILAGHGGWPAGVAAGAVGQATARALARLGVGPILAAEAGADSESLLALGAYAAVAGKRVLVIRGEGGRELIADALRGRGARVDYAECYRRVRPDGDPAALLADWAAGGIAAVTVTSREVFANLAAMLGEAGAGRLRATPLFAPHARIAEAARQWGVAEVVATPPGDAGLVSALIDWFNRHHD